MKRLYINISKLVDSDTTLEEIECSYFYHRENEGALSLLEVAEFAIYCRQCKDAFCVEACPKDALELTDEDLVKRYDMRCVGCETCILACPFGTIFPDVMNYIHDKCDLCLDKRKMNSEYIPKCVKTSPSGAIELKDIEENPEENIYHYGEHIAIDAHNWLKKEERI